MQRGKHRQQIDSFHLLHIFSYLQMGGGGNKAWTILLQQRTISISDINPNIFFDKVHIQQVSGPHMKSKFSQHKIYWLYCDWYWMRTNCWYDVSFLGSLICHTALNVVLMGYISVGVVVLMMLVLLNGEYRISEE